MDAKCPRVVAFLPGTIYVCFFLVVAVANSNLTVGKEIGTKSSLLHDRLFFDVSVLRIVQIGRVTYSCTKFPGFIFSLSI